MKILVSTDIEGVAGVVHPEQTRAGNAEYEQARSLMTDEANAAIAGAFDASASAVYVNDSHGGFRNLLAARLDRRAQAILGKPRHLGMMAGLELSIDAVCMVGYHSRAQGRGILAHTINSFAFARILYGDSEIGEAGIYGALAGERGVPVAMASGDDAFIDEHRSVFPDTTFVQTKQATGHTSGISLSPAEACAAIRAGVVSGLSKIGAARPYRIETPIAVRVQTTSPALADLFSQWPTLERSGASEIAFTAPSAEAAVRMLNCLSAMSSMLR